MPNQAKYKSKGGDKDSAVKHAMNPPTGGGQKPDIDAKGSEEQDVKRRIGQFTGAGEPAQVKK